ncbi:kinase-like protein [Xylaria sp. FL1042]|nr:kinase-like protein [Xylaria sp. FL1042]
MSGPRGLRPPTSPSHRSPPPPMTVRAAPRLNVPLQPWKPPMDELCISKQMGAEVRFDHIRRCVLKRGNRVRPNEETALRLVKKYTTIPVPEVYDSEYTTKNRDAYGQIWMQSFGGEELDEIWDDLDDATKERLCHELWGFVKQLRNIPKPPELAHLYQCSADGSACQDVLLEDLTDPPVPILDDESLRNRINERYLHCNGASYRENLLDYLPRSNVSVFTHADMAPRNVMVDPITRKINVLLDWEFAGWYPDYWEYAKMQVQWGREDYMRWMEKTRPQDWDIIGIHKAKRVLF